MSVDKTDTLPASLGDNKFANDVLLLLFEHYPEFQNMAQQLANAKKELEEEKQKREEAEQIVINNQREVLKLKTKLEQVQEYIKTIENCKITGNLEPYYKYEYNICDYSEYTTDNDVIYIFNVLMDLTTVTIGAGKYLLEKKDDIVIIFVILSSKDVLINEKYRYNGTAVDFVSCWNKNVAANIQNSDRRKTLTIENTTSFQKMTNQGICKLDPNSWLRLYTTSNRRTRQMERAVNIHSRMKQVFGKTA